MAGAGSGPSVPPESSIEPTAPLISGTPSGVEANSGLGGAAAQPVKPTAPVPLHSKIAEGIIHAFAGTDGTAGSALKSALAGGLAGLAAAARTPRQPGAPILSGLGVGAEAAIKQREQQTERANALKQQGVENQEKQQTIDLAKQREQRESTTGDRDYDLRLREDARQQAESVRKGVEFEKRSTLLDQAIKEGDYNSLKQHAADLQTYADQWNDLQSHGGKRLVVNGAESPEFDHLGDARDFAISNFDAAAHPDMKTRLMRNPETGKWAIMETPYEAPKWHDITDATGKPQKIYTDTMGALAAQEQVAKTKHYLAVAGKSSLDLKKDLEEYKEDGTVKGARKKLNENGGDYSKLGEGDKEALLGDASKRFNMAQTGLEKELQKPEDLQDKASVDFLKQQRDMYAKEISTLGTPSWVDKNVKPGDKPAANTPPPAAAPPRPQNVPSDYVFQNGAKGPGWYKPAAPEPFNPETTVTD